MMPATKNKLNMLIGNMEKKPPETMTEAELKKILKPYKIHKQETHLKNTQMIGRF